MNKNRRYLILILLIAFALRVYQLGVPSLWYDETVSAYLASLPIPEMIGHTARDIHPPAYYLLLRLWSLLVGNSEYALAFFSLIFGLLLIPATYRLALDLTKQHRVANWTAFFIAISPYNLWYSQEVRMYTLGAFLGVVATWSLGRAVNLRTSAPPQSPPEGGRFHSPLPVEEGLGGKFYSPLPWGKGLGVRGYYLIYILCATLGLYTLYYFAFLLIIINLFFLGQTLYPRLNRQTLTQLLGANLAALILYLPWLPIAWRQATNPPVPPWRTPDTWRSVLLESWSALSLGQSVDPTTIWPLLLVSLLLFGLGLYRAYAHPTTRSITALLLSYTLGPLLIIQLFSLITPLYHVRYIFTYSPLFYIVLALGIDHLLRGRLEIGDWEIQSSLQPLAWLIILVVTSASGYSIWQYHTHPRYQPDDFRAAVRFIEAHWEPGDVILTNAGYTYTAYEYYTTHPTLERHRLVPYSPPSDPTQPLLLQGGTVDGPATLGWGDPRSDFYAMSQTDTEQALNALSQDYQRLWLLRAYDTVTDPSASIRSWLTENTIPLEDQVFSGESNIRAQGFLLSKQPALGGELVHFEDGLALTGWHLPLEEWSPGQTVPLTLGWQTTTPPTVDYKMSLKLWAADGTLAAQGNDTWPVGTLYRPTTWPLNRLIPQPIHLTLPPHLASGQYWLNVELYHPDTAQPLARLDGADPVVTLGPVWVR